MCMPMLYVNLLINTYRVVFGFIKKQIVENQKQNIYTWKRLEILECRKIRDKLVLPNSNSLQLLNAQPMVEFPCIPCTCTCTLPSVGTLIDASSDLYIIGGTARSSEFFSDTSKVRSSPFFVRWFGHSIDTKQNLEPREC